MRIALASDRNGLDYKLRLIEHLKEKGYEPVDVGTYENVPCDTPVYAAKAAKFEPYSPPQCLLLICCRFQIACSAS